MRRKHRGDLLTLRAFDSAVISTIRAAGSQDSHLMNATASLSLHDLWVMYGNSRKLRAAGTQFGQFPAAWGDVAHRLYIQELHTGLIVAHRDLFCSLIISAFEIVLGKILHNSHYLYAKVAAGTYYAEADIVETMAEIREDESAETIRKHLDD